MPYESWEELDTVVEESGRHKVGLRFTGSGVDPIASYIYPRSDAASPSPTDVSSAASSWIARKNERLAEQSNAANAPELQKLWNRMLPILLNELVPWCVANPTATKTEAGLAMSALFPEAPFSWPEVMDWLLSSISDISGQALSTWPDLRDYFVTNAASYRPGG